MKIVLFNLQADSILHASRAFNSWCVVFSVFIKNTFSLLLLISSTFFIDISSSSSSIIVTFNLNVANPTKIVMRSKQIKIIFSHFIPPSTLKLNWNNSQKKMMKERKIRHLSPFKCKLTIVRVLLNYLQIKREIEVRDRNRNRFVEKSRDEVGKILF